MTKIKFLILCVCIFCFSNIYAGTCTVKISDRIDFFKKNYSGEMRLFLSLSFEINNSKIKTTDTSSINILANNVGFDTVKYHYENQNGITISESFICKLTSGETYTISPCTCCGIFLMTPSENAKRGFVKIENSSNKEFLAITSEFDYDTIPKLSKTDFIPSLISLNCGFRPNRIFIANFQYQDKKYQYENWKTKTAEEKKLLESEQESHITFSFNYLFLNEEKLIISINENADKFSVKLSE